MKKKITTVTEEFDKDGSLKSRTTETAEEEDDGYIYPQYSPVYPWHVPMPEWKPEWVYRPETSPTCSPPNFGPIATCSTSGE